MKMNILATLIVLSTCVFSTESFAVTLSCRNLFSKPGVPATLTAHIVRDDELSEISLVQDPNGVMFKVIDLKKSVKSKEIISNHSPYKGHQEFEVATGIRLILPKNLSSESLKTTSFEAGKLPPNLKSLQNGVIEAAGSLYPTNQGGSVYTRMHCTSL